MLSSSNETQAWYLFYHDIHVYLSATLCCVGIILNLILIFVLSRPKMRSVVNYFLMTIATSMNIVMLSCLIYGIHFHLMPDTECFHWKYTWGWAVFNLIYVNLTVIFRACSLWLSAVMAAYRCHIICGPITQQPAPNSQTGHLEARRSLIRAGLIIFGTFLLVLFLSTPVYFIHTVKGYASAGCGEHTNQTVMIYNVDRPRLVLDHNGLGYRLALCTNAFLLKLIPILVLGFYLLRIIAFMHKYNRYREVNLNLSLPDQRSFLYPTTQIFLAIILTTFLLETPQTVISVIMVGTFRAEASRENLYSDFGDLFDDLALCACLTTFPLYCGMSRRFRETFKSIFTRQT